MHRNDKSRFLLYIEPKKEEKLKVPINDELTELMEMAMRKSTEGAANYSDINDVVGKFKKGNGWKGDHGTDCGECSSNHDYLLNNGLITNSLSVFYVKYYRNSIHENDWIKLKQLGDYYDVDIQLPKTFPISPSSTIHETYDDYIKNIFDSLSNELGKQISKEIIEKIKKLENVKNIGKTGIY